MENFISGFTKEEQEEYEELLFKIKETTDFETIKKMQSRITLLKENGLLRLKKEKQK